MKMIFSKWFMMLIMALCVRVSIAQTYYVDANAGSDNNNGSSTSRAFKNLTKLYNLNFGPGGRIFLKAGSVWTGQQLKFKGSGSSSSPIIVNSYGSGAKPVIHGNGIVGQGVVYLYNQEYIEINNLEITNTPGGPSNSNFFIGLYDNTVVPNPNPLGADRRGVMVAIDNFGTADHIWLKNMDIHHIKGQLGSGQNTVNGALPKRTGGIYFAVLDSLETATKNSRFNDIKVDSCNIYYCENIGLALDNEWNVYYPGGANSSNAADRAEYANWFNRRFSNVLIKNNVIHHIGKNAMIIRCTDSTGLIERNVCYETALGTTGNTMFTARAKGTVFQYNEGYFNRATTQTIDPGNYDGSMYDPDYGSVGVIFQYSYSHDNSEGIYWGCNTRSLTNNESGVPDPGDIGCTLRYCISQNDIGDLIFFNYPSAGNEIYNNVFYIKAGSKPNIIHESSSKNHTYNFYNNIIYNLSSAINGADYEWGDGLGVQIRNISNNTFYGSHHATEPEDPFKLITDPMFVNPGSGTTGLTNLNGYRLNFGSTALGSGKLIPANGGKDFYSNIVSASALPARGVYEGAGVGAPIPVITSFTPANGASGTVVTVRGSGFTGIQSIKIGGTNAASFTVLYDTIINVVVGNGATGLINVANSYTNASSSGIFTYCTKPNAPSASNATVCLGSVANLTASGIGMISWYDVPSGGIKLATGASFTTPPISNTTIYYVEDSSCAVSATRTAVIVNVFGSTNVGTRVTACESYSWNGITYITSGTYYKSYTNVNGCTAVDTLYLTINKGAFTKSIISSCESYFWKGNTYTTSGTYTNSYSNPNGCLSVDTLVLTINRSTRDTSNIIACDSYIWHGTTYTTSGTFSFDYLNASGCASTDILNLVIKKSSSNVITKKACANYKWHGITYVNSGTYYYNYINEVGCPSVDTLILTIL